MKLAQLIAGLALGIPVIICPAHATSRTQEFTCTSRHVADAGYAVTVSADYKTAVLEEMSFIGTKKIADMICTSLPVRHYPDALNNYLVCEDVRVANSPIVRFWVGGIAGFNYAEVLNVDGGKEELVEFGHLECAR